LKDLMPCSRSCVTYPSD